MTETLPSASDPRIQRAVRIASRVSLADLRLLGCQCGQSEQTLAGAPLSDNLNQAINIRSSRNEAGPHGQIVLFITFRLFASDEPFEVGDQAPLLIEATFVLIYNLLEPIDTTETDIQTFGQMNGLLNIWPYWRELVQSSTSRMGLPPIRVPLLTPATFNFKQAEMSRPAKVKTKGHSARSARKRK